MSSTRPKSLILCSANPGGFENLKHLAASHTPDGVAEGQQRYSTLSDSMVQGNLQKLAGDIQPT